MPYVKYGPFTDLVGAPGISAEFLNPVETALDAVVNRRGFVSVTEYGAKLDGTTDDTTAIQNALNTGANVMIAGTATTPGIAKTTATLTLKTSAAGQQLVTSNASIQPAFVGDAVFLGGALQRVQATILGTLQPGGTYTNVAAIRIGSSSYNPQQASVAYSDVRSWQGSGIIWDQGAMIDFTHFHVDTASGDGIRATYNLSDNNHGWFANTHIVNASGVGYAIYGDGTNLTNGGSRHNVFADAKAFGCGQNFLIQSRDNEGSIFSEQSGTPSTTTSTSRGNYLRVLETATEFEAWVDAGSGNRIEGFSNGNAYETKNAVIRTLTVGGTSTTAGTRFSQAISGQYTIGTSTVANGAIAAYNPAVSGLGSGRVVNATMFTSVGGGVILQPFIDGGGNLQFVVVNSSGSSQTLTGSVISYVIWRFA